MPTGIRVHRLSDIDANNRTGVCSKCGPVKLKKKPDGWRCNIAHNLLQKKYLDPRRPWRQHKKDKCEHCGFIPQHPSQLDVDHIDGNKKNDDPSNYQTLCANCHRLKTQVNKDWENKKTAPPN